jgi:hypothetical protein
MILLAIGWVVFEKWAECAWFNHSVRRAQEIMKERRERGSDFKPTFKTKWIDFWQDIIYDTEQPFD